MLAPFRGRGMASAPKVGKITVLFQDVSAQCIVREEFDRIRQYQEDAATEGGALDNRNERIPLGRQYSVELRLPCETSFYMTVLKDLRSELYPGSYRSDSDTGLRYMMCIWRGVPCMLTDAILSMIVAEAVSDGVIDGQLSIKVYNDSPRTSVPFSRANTLHVKEVHRAFGIQYIRNYRLADCLPMGTMVQFAAFLQRLGIDTNLEPNGFHWDSRGESSQIAASGRYLESIFPIDVLIKAIGGPGASVLCGEWTASVDNVSIENDLTNTHYTGKADYFYRLDGRSLILSVDLKTGPHTFNKTESELEVMAYSLNSERPVLHVATDLNQMWHVYLFEKNTELKCIHMELPLPKVKTFVLFYCLHSVFYNEKTSTQLDKIHQKWFRDDEDDDEDEDGKQMKSFKRAKPSDFGEASSSLTGSKAADDSANNPLPSCEMQEEAQQMLDQEIEEYIAENSLLYEHTFDNELELRNFLRKKYIFNAYADQKYAADAGLSLEEYFQRQQVEAEAEQEKRVQGGIAAREDFMTRWAAGISG